MPALAILNLTGCGGSGPGAGNYCQIAKPIYFQPDDPPMTRTTERAIIVHNETGAKLCGWR